MAKSAIVGDPYENLANTIILTAACDYRRALKRYEKNLKSKEAEADVDELERFFRSKWYSALTTIDGEFLISKIRAEYDIGQSE